MALCYEKDMKFAYVGEFWKGCGLWVILKWWIESYLKSNETPPDVDGCGS